MKVAQDVYRLAQHGLSYTPAQVRGMSHRDRDVLLGIADGIEKQRALVNMRQQAKATLPKRPR